MNTFKDLLPMLSILLTAVFGLLAYAWQEKVKRQTALTERKQKLYEQLIRNFVDLLVAKTAAERSKFTTEIERGWLFASDDVLLASYAYLNAFDRLMLSPEEAEVLPVERVIERIKSDSKVGMELSQCLAAIFLAMRQDIRPETAISADWAKQQLRFYKWGALAEFQEVDSPDPSQGTSVISDFD
ncbi:MAG: hypothetical protein M3R52_13705 [Acidobacteriota bacterium]|nr:hypothetical protein [Acidobacteriota bacterium]